MLQYRDGGTVKLPISYRCEAVGEDMTGDSSARGEGVDDRGALTAWLGQGVYTERWGQPPQRLYLQRLVNPEPQRKLKSFSLTARHALFLVAATVERLGPQKKH
jgi:hypothetical protein